MRHRAQASAYEIMGCRRPVREYVTGLRFSFYIGYSTGFPVGKILLTLIKTTTLW